MDQQPLLRSERLVLRALEPRDDGLFWRLRTDPVVMQWLERDEWATVDRAREERLKLKAGTEAGKWYFWALSEGPSSPLIGTVCLWNFNPDRTDCEIGFELFPARQGRGLMAEAVDAVFDWSWSALPLNGISALTHKDNAAARVFLERKGFLTGPIPTSWDVVEAEAETQAYYRLSRPT